jgi:4-diphosphocytidyl-2-C-methyl-D-erythritol kinase
MHIQRLAPAKINLMLNVVGRLNNGYHHLQTLMAFVDCCDVLELTTGCHQDTLTITGIFADALKKPGINSVLQAKQWFYQYFDVPVLSFQIALEKNLPVAAGIGGGTSDAAAMIAALIDIHQLELSLTQKQQLVIASGMLGADVPVCLAFQLGLGQYFWLDGSGTKELPQTLKFEEPVDIILINPDIAVNTGTVFQSLNQSFSIAIPTPVITSTSEMLTFLSHTQNDLQQPACQAYPSIPDISSIVKNLADPPAIVRQTGSGSTYFALTPNTKTACTLARHLQQSYSNWWVKTGKTF